MEEYFDIYNEHNEPLGEKLPRSVVHSENKHWHRTTHIWIVNANHEVLCQQRSMSKDKNPGKWQSFFGGHLKAGQSFLDSAKEEMMEELGMEIKELDMIPLYVKKSQSAKHFAQVYILVWNGNTSELKFKDQEVAQVKWVPLVELKKLMTSGDFCNSLDEQVIRFLVNNQSN